MVSFKQKVDKSNKLYIFKPLRQAGFAGTVEIVPGRRAAIVYPEGTPVSEVYESLKVSLLDFQHQARESHAAPKLNKELLGGL